MPSVIRMFRNSDDVLLATEAAPSEGTHDPADIFDLSALNAVDVYFTIATGPTAEYTTPDTTVATSSAFVSPFFPPPAPTTGYVLPLYEVNT